MITISIPLQRERAGRNIKEQVLIALYFKPSVIKKNVCISRDGGKIKRIAMDST